MAGRGAGEEESKPIHGIDDQFNDWGGGGDVTYLSPFLEGTA